MPIILRTLSSTRNRASLPASASPPPTGRPASSRSAIAVPRSRFQPVKTTNELLLLRSDVFDLGADSRLNQTVPDVPRVDLDGRFYKLIDDFEARVTVAPSLKAATSFVVKGDWTFDRPVVAEGAVTYADLGRPAVAGVDDPA